MKKILTVSLVAIMAVGAAHANIASTDWTMEQLGTTEASLQGKIDQKVATSTYEQDKTALQDAIDAKVAQSEYDTKMTDIAKDIASKVAQTAYDAKMQTIDSKLDQVATSDNFNLLKTDVENLQTSLTDTGATGSRIKALETADGTMSGQITALQNKDTEIAGQITALQGADTTMSGKITALENKDTAIEGKIGTVEEGKNLATMLSEETSARTQADTRLDERLGTAEDEISSQGEEISGLDGRLTTAETDINNLEASLADGGATDSRFDAIEAEQITQNTNITNLQTADTELAAEDTRLAGLIDDNATAISDETTARTNADTNLQGQIGTYDAETQTWSGMKGDIADLTAEKVAIAQGQNHAVMTTDAAGNVIPVVPTECEDAESFCVLTSNGVGTYKWENIARATKTSGGDEVQD